MIRIDTETKRKHREMGATAMLDALEGRGENLMLGLAVEEQVKLVCEEAHTSCPRQKVEGLIHRAGLRYPNADLRRLDLLAERGLDQCVIAQLGTCSFFQRQLNAVFQGITGSRKSFLRCALAKHACLHRVRAHYIRMPDLAEARALAKDKPQGHTKSLRKYAAFSLLVIDEWLPNHPDDDMRARSSPGKWCSGPSMRGVRLSGRARSRWSPRSRCWW